MLADGDHGHGDDADRSNPERPLKASRIARRGKAG
jgi:hypothetical protein